MSVAADRIETGTVVVDGVATFYRRLPGQGNPTLFVHGNPTHSEDWLPILERMQGPAIAPDLPGFGRSERPPPERFDYTIDSYGRFLGSFLERLGIDRYALAVHDWGTVGLLEAQRDPERVQRLLLCACVPLLPGYRWHRTARIWRTPVIGELFNRVWSRAALDQGLRETRGDWSRHDPAFVDLIWDHLDRGTFEAILRLYRSAPEDELERRGSELARLTAPALVLWPLRDRYIGPGFGRAFAERLPGAELVELPASGHWPWRDEPALIERIVRFLEPPQRRSRDRSGRARIEGSGGAVLPRGEPGY